MKNILLLVVLVCLPTLAHAQFVLNAYDADDNNLGAVAWTGESATWHMIFTPDSVGIKVTSRTGEVANRSPTADVYFAGRDCHGQAYANTDLPGFSLISPYPQPGNGPDPLFLYNREDARVAVWIQSLATGSENEGGCRNVYDEIIGVPVTLISDPTQYGLSIVANGTAWGFTPPITIKVEKVAPYSNIVFCNGFESCPTP